MDKARRISLLIVYFAWWFKLHHFKTMLGDSWGAVGFFGFKCHCRTIYQRLSRLVTIQQICQWPVDHAIDCTDTVSILRYLGCTFRQFGCYRLGSFCTINCTKQEKWTKSKKDFSLIVYFLHGDQLHFKTMLEWWFIEVGISLGSSVTAGLYQRPTRALSTTSLSMACGQMQSLTPTQCIIILRYWDAFHNLVVTHETWDVCTINCTKAKWTKKAGFSTDRIFLWWFNCTTLKTMLEWFVRSG
jgi:hypothetical protein